MEVNSALKVIYQIQKWKQNKKKYNNRERALVPRGKNEKMENSSEKEREIYEK